MGTVSKMQDPILMGFLIRDGKMGIDICFKAAAGRIKDHFYLYVGEHKSCSQGYLNRRKYSLMFVKEN